MRHFNILTLLAIASVSVAACGTSDENEYLGSRDDIIIKNRNMPQPVKEEAAMIAEAKVDAAKEEGMDKVKEMAAEKVASEKFPEGKELEEIVDSVKNDPVTTIETKEMAKAEVESAADAVKEEVKEVVADRVEEKAADVVETPAPMGTTTMKGPAAVAEVASSSPVAPPAGYQGDIPPSAKPGECYAKILIPAVVEQVKEKLQISEEQEVLARIIPAKYEVTKEQVLVREARQYWKKGRGLNEKVDAATGEILCLVEEPAVYKTIEKRTLVEPEKPEYKTIPPQYEHVTKTNVVEAERMEWKRILCDTNVTPAKILEVQKALEAKGFSVGKMDGKFGRMTAAALRAYQAKNKLPVGNLSYETLEHLGVSPAGAS